MQSIADFLLGRPVDWATWDNEHFWSRARHDVIVGALRRHGLLVPGVRFADIGCGTGYVATILSRHGLRVVGGDRNPGKLRFCRSRGVRTACVLDALRLPFRGGLDGASLLDVIEHVRDDVGLLAEVRRALRPGGLLLVTVPADPRLYGRFDEEVGHVRRYDRRGLIARLDAAGFTVLECRPFFWSLHLAMRVIRRLLPGGELETRPDGDPLLKMPGPWVNRVSMAALQFDRRLGNRRTPANGASLLAMARRPEMPDPRPRNPSAAGGSTYGRPSQDGS